jgi:cytochrome c-type biogenesis protein CcmH
VTLFVVVAALMVAVALAWVLVPLLRYRASSGIGREASNVALLRDQLAELDADLANGTLARGQYEQARQELELRVLDESRAAEPRTAGAPPAAAAWTAAVLAGSIPVIALVLYVALGDHEAFSPAATQVAKRGGEHDITPEQVDKMADSLAAKLAQDPENVEGWVMLARTYYSRSRHAEAAKAFERAVALLPGNADLLADYADALGATQGALAGKPEQLIQQALAADPTQWKALALAGTIAFDRKEYAKAVAYWERLKTSVPPGAPIAQSIDASIAEARQLGGLGTAAVPPIAGLAPPPVAPPSAPSATPKAPAVPKTTVTAGSAQKANAAGGASIAGTVKLAPELAGKAAPTDAVFIFARPAQGPKMPLAILKRQVKDLPSTFTLDDSTTMSPGGALSGAGDVIVGARVSRSGDAMPKGGDFEGLSDPVKVGASGVTIVIDRIIP